MAKEDVRAYFKLDVGYLSNPKIAELMDEHPRAVLLHIQCIAYAAQHLTDGVVPVRLAMRFACASQSDLDACADAGLLRKVNATHVEVHDYLKHQRSAESVKGRSEQAKRAARERWEAEKADAERMQNALPSAMQREKEREINTSPASVHDASDAAAPDGAGHGDRFEEFWDVYDYKKDRKRAEQKWKAALKKPGVTADLLIAAAAQYVGHKKAAGKHPEFTKHADAWLNGENWNDEIPTEATEVTDQPSRPTALRQCDAPAPHERHRWEDAHNRYFCQGEQ